MGELLTLLLWLAGAAAIDSSSSPAEQPLESSPNTLSEAKPEIIPIEVYNGPKVISTVDPKYPFRARRNDEEGWVQLNMMVDTQGKPYEISASDFSGDGDFVEAAIASAQQWRFDPANLDGVPLDAGADFKITFELAGGTNGATRSFVRKYKGLLAAIERGEREQADLLLEALQAKNLYEDAYYNMGRYTYAEKWGTKSSRRQALHRAIAYEKDAKYLSEATFTSALRQLVVLQLAEERYAEALNSIKRLLDPQRKLSAEIRENIQVVHEELLALRDSDSSLSRNATVGQSNSYWLVLWRNQFAVKVLSGEVAELKLRCGKGYVFFRFDPTLAYTAPNSDKSCVLQVLGNPGSELLITQH